MRLRPILLISILPIGILANYVIEGEESDLIAAPLVRGAETAKDVYDGCKELDEGGVQVSVGEKCFWNALQYMIQALSDAQNNTGVALLSNTVNNMQSIAHSPPASTPSSTSSSSWEPVPSAASSPPSKSKRQDESAGESFLESLNDEIRRRSEDIRRPRAIHVEGSEVHLTHGLAIRTNVHSGDAILHVHTNGSHALAAFTRNALPQSDRRDTASTPEPEYRFEGAQGLKLLVRVAEEQAYTMFSTLLSELAHGKDEMAPKLKESDSWAFALCKRSGQRLMLQGKLIAEDNGAGSGWESEGLIDCKA